MAVCRTMLPRDTACAKWQLKSHKANLRNINRFDTMLTKRDLIKFWGLKHHHLQWIPTTLASQMIRLKRNVHCAQWVQCQVQRLQWVTQVAYIRITVYSTHIHPYMLLYKQHSWELIELRSYSAVVGDQMIQLIAFSQLCCELIQNQIRQQNVLNKVFIWDF